MEEKTIPTSYDMLIMEHSVQFADKAVKSLIAHTMDEKVDTLFNTVVEPSYVVIDDGKTEYFMSLELVSKDYELDLAPFNGDKDINARGIFLLDTAKDVYYTIKRNLQLQGLENNTHFNYVLQLGPNATLFLDENSEKRIGVVIKNNSIEV
jgi:hypothetical protein